MSKTIYHLSHTDLDGFSAQLIMSYTPHKIYSFNANYGAEVPEKLEEILNLIKKEKTDATILITDLNLTNEESKWLDREVEKIKTPQLHIEIVLLDHHGSGKEASEKYSWYYLDTSRSATKITYEYAKENFNLHEPEWMNRYVDVVNAVDIWLQSEVENFEYGKVCMRIIFETRELNRVIFADEDREYKLTLLTEAAKMIGLPNAHILLDDAIHRLKKDFFRENEDNTIDNLSTKKIVSLLGSKKSEMTIYYKNYKGFLSYGVGNTSIIGNEFLNQYPEFDFIVDVSTRGTMSFRANNRVDVAQMAKEWAGGGGHPNASGGRIQGFKEQYLYKKAKEQVEAIINKAEATAGKLNFKQDDEALKI